MVNWYQVYLHPRYLVIDVPWPLVSRLWDSLCHPWYLAPSHLSHPVMYPNIPCDKVPCTLG
ncbi:hypothetical protein AVEN_158786-1, partial [Araneus ventricosus]